MDALHHHIDHERDEDMPHLEKLLAREESESIARSFQKTKGTTPTRNHPPAPTEFYMESFATLIVAPMDKFKDLLGDFPDEDDQRKTIERTNGSKNRNKSASELSI